MYQLIYFIKKYSHFLYFVLLQCIAFALTISNYNFHKSKFVSSANYFTGSVFEMSSSAYQYFNLKSENQRLSHENNALRNQLARLTSINKPDNKSLDTIYSQKFSYLNGRIIKNNYRNPINFITIAIGQKKGVTKEMGVINDKGIIGIVDDVSSNYARVQSILNRNSKINVRFKNNFYFGTLTWNGEDYNVVQLTDIPRQALFKKGDTIITGGKSVIFPEGIPVGTVMEVPKKLTASNTLNIKLFNDMSNLNYVYVIKSFDKKEVELLENKTYE